MSESSSAIPSSKFFALYRGDSFDTSVTISDADGDPTDLTGATVRAQIRQEDDTLLDSFTADLSAAEEGLILLSLDPLQTAALPTAETLRSDLEVTYPSGEVKTVLIIAFTVVGDISHD